VILPRLACDAGCCVVTTDPAHQPPRGNGHPRPMFQVLPDRAATSTGDVLEMDTRVMRVDAREYERADRWFL
jgi:hypothetical protein